MSLINQMLQDLEKRRASEREWSQLPNELRPLPDAQGARVSGMLRSMALVIFAMAVLLAGWHYLHQPIAEWIASSGRTPAEATTSSLRLSHQLMQAPETPVADAVEVESSRATGGNEPETAVETLAQRVSQTVAAADVAASTVPATPRPEPLAAVSSPDNVTIMKAVAVTSTSLRLTPSASLGKSDPPSRAPSAAALSPPSTKAGEEGRPAAAATPPHIDKRAQQLTPQQQAENEYREAAHLLGQGKLAEAEQGFRNALAHASGHAGARQGLFGLLLNAKRNAEAEQVLAEALKLNPNQPGFAMAAARLQTDRNDITAAIETLQKSAPHALNSPDYQAFIAALMQRQSRHLDAIEHYQAALRLAPGAGVWLMGMGISLQAIHRNAEANEAFRRARATNGLNPELQAFVEQRLKQLQ